MRTQAKTEEGLQKAVGWLGAALQKVTLRKRLPKRLNTKTAYWRGFAAGAREAQSIAWSEREVAAYYRRNRL